MITGPPAIHSPWLQAARIACFVGLAAWMMFEWHRWPNGSSALGPLGLVWYGESGIQSLLLCSISVLLVLAFLIRPNAFTAVISALGAFHWAFWGTIALGAGC
jgi:hypothetical protein